MKNKKVLIICKSVHHGNTMKIAEIMADELNAYLKEPSKVNLGEIAHYDLLGFGSGIYNQKHHESLFNLVDKIQEKSKAFIFSTASFRFKRLHEALRNKVIEKEMEIIGEFCCKGFMNHSFTKYFFGGINKNRPNEKDFRKARDFCIDLKGNF